LVSPASVFGIPDPGDLIPDPGDLIPDPGDNTAVEIIILIILLSIIY
jgi:hypothetical protein